MGVSVTEQEVVVVLTVEGLSDRSKMERHLKREGLHPIEGEPFAYLGSTTTDPIKTLLFVFDGIKKAIHKGGFVDCDMMVSIGEYPMEAYRFDRERDEFVAIAMESEA
jgi:hypothetical protein